MTFEVLIKPCKPWELYNQPFPSPAMIPAGFAIIIIDLKDCFFTIPLHNNDKEKFAFTLHPLIMKNQLNNISGKHYLKV
jgi:hypothetical protein